MDNVEVNNMDEGYNFDAENEDLFTVPPPLEDLGTLLAEDPDIAGQNSGVRDNDAGDESQENSEKKKRRVSKPRVVLNEERLCSKKGIEALKNLCSDVQFKGKGHEVSDLNKLLHRFEHWAQCLMPRWPFDDVVQKCEILGSKSRVKNELKRIRGDDEDIVLRGEPEDGDEVANDGETNEDQSTEPTTQEDVQREEDQAPVELTEEQLERIRRNRELALERREANRRQREAYESQTQAESEESLDAQLERIERNRKRAEERREANKRRRLAEENHTESDMDDLADSSLIAHQGNSSGPTSNVASEIMEPGKTIGNTNNHDMQNDRHDQNSSMDGINDEDILNSIAELNDNTDAATHDYENSIIEHININDETSLRVTPDTDTEIDFIGTEEIQNINNDLDSMPEIDDNIGHHSETASGMRNASQTLKLNGLKEDKATNDVLDSDDDSGDEILNRSVFEDSKAHMTTPDDSLPVKTNKATYLDSSEDQKLSAEGASENNELPDESQSYANEDITHVETNLPASDVILQKLCQPQETV